VRLVLVANARMPSQRAQSLQVVQMAAAFARAGSPTTLLYARRIPTPPLPPGQDVLDYYGVPEGPRPRLEAVPCVDWIDRVPRRVQYAPARLQELTFALRAASLVQHAHAGARVLAREVETARRLGAKGHARVYLEVHRVPGGRLRRRWLREASESCRGIVAISGGVAADLAALGVAADRVRVEPDGFEAARFADPPTRTAAREELGLDPGATVCVYTGGLLAWKGVDLLVEAARRLPEVQFVVAGGMDADVEELRRRAAGMPHVRIDGFQPPARVATYLAAADLGVVPNRSRPAISARYTSPLKVYEALAVGLPLVASNLPSLREVLEADRTAVLVAPDDVEALRAGIARLAGDAELRARMGVAAREGAGRFTWDARARRLLDWMDAREAAA